MLASLLAFSFVIPVYAVDEITENSVLDLKDCIELSIKNSPKVNIQK